MWLGYNDAAQSRILHTKTHGLENLQKLETLLFVFQCVDAFSNMGTETIAKHRVTVRRTI